MLNYFFKGNEAKWNESTASESEDPTQALKDALDARGVFSMNKQDGTYNLSAMKVLKVIVLRQAAREMTRTHEPALQAEKIAAFKA
jgi:hypothetical protein